MVNLYRMVGVMLSAEPVQQSITDQLRNTRAGFYPPIIHFFIVAMCFVKPVGISISIYGNSLFF